MLLSLNAMQMTLMTWTEIKLSKWLALIQKNKGKFKDCSKKMKHPLKGSSTKETCITQNKRQIIIPVCVCHFSSMFSHIIMIFVSLTT